MYDWHGIYYVKKVLGPNVYLVQKPGCRKTKVPADRLKLFNEFLHSDDPNVKITPDDDDNHNDDLQDNQVDDAQDSQVHELDQEQEPSDSA